MPNLQLSRSLHTDTISNQDIPPAHQRRLTPFTSPLSQPLPNPRKRQVSHPPSPSFTTSIASSSPTSSSSGSTNTIGTTTPIPASNTDWRAIASMSSTITPTPSIEGAQSQTNNTSSHGSQFMVLGAIGGVVGIVILSLAFYYILRRRRSSRNSMVVSRLSMGEKGEKGSYTPLHDQFVNQQPTTASIAPQGQQRSWWQSFKQTPVALPMVPGPEQMDGMLKKKGTGPKPRPRTLYKVRNHKPTHSFEIDSEAASSVVDLSSCPH